MGLFQKSISADFDKGTLSDWGKVVAEEQPATGAIRNGRYELGPLEGGALRRGLKAKPGKKYAVRFLADVVKPPANGIPANFSVGPVFYDENGKLVGYYKKFPALPPKKPDKVVLQAPENAATVRIGVFGSWAPPGEKAADCVIAFRELTLTEA